MIIRNHIHTKGCFIIQAFTHTARNCVESPYPMATTAHKISINLEMYHRVAKLLSCVVNEHQKGLKCGFADKNSEHFNVGTVWNLCKWKIAHFDRISYGDFS